MNVTGLGECQQADGCRSEFRWRKKPTMILIAMAIPAVRHLPRARAARNAHRHRVTPAASVLRKDRHKSGF
jgi:hypothetical protein